jgi:2'-5' RNA ligase
VLRLFAAIALPGEISALLVPRQTGLSGARWRPREALHITLRFFGPTPEPAAADLAVELERAAIAPFDLVLEGAGAFGEADRLRTLWAAVAPLPPLDRLAGRVETAARRAGLAAETRKFTPHVTLAYLSRPDPAEAAGWIAANNLLKTPPFKVTRFGLYSSWPGEGGSRYELERLYRLG